MRILVASDDDALSEEIRSLLVHAGNESDLLSFTSLDSATDCLIQFQPETIILVLCPNWEVGIAVMRECLQVSPTRVLAIGPATDPQFILNTLQEGAYHYVDKTTLKTQLTAGLARLSSEIPVPRKIGRVIAVLGTCGGAGSSTLAVNIAIVLAQQYETTGLIDLNLAAGDLSMMLNLAPERNVADFCRNASRMDKLMFEQCFTRHESGVQLLGSSPVDLRETAEITPRDIGKMIGMARSAFPFVVVDVERPFGKKHEQALLQADVILLVMRLDFASLRQTSETIARLTKLGIAKDRILLIVNRYRQPKELRIADVEKALKTKISFFIPNDPQHVNQANNSGIPLVLRFPRAKSAKSITSIAWKLNGLSG